MILDRTDELTFAIRADLPRDFLVDLAQTIPTAALQAKQVIRKSHTLVSGGIPLGERRGNQSAGLVRYSLTDEAFEQLALRHEGQLIGQVAIRADKPRLAALHLTTVKFGGTLLGFASHREKDDLPVANASRKALCTLNRGLGPSLLDPPELFRDNERFAILLVRRDRSDIGKVASMTMAVANHDLTQLLLKVDLSDFLAGYGTKPERARGVVLKDPVTSFKEKTAGAMPAKKGDAAG